MTIADATTNTRARIERQIVLNRHAAKRLSRHDPKRDALDAENDELVDRWLAA